MPYVKSISIHSTPKKSIAYIVKKEKTDDLLYVSGFNVATDPEIAYHQMKTVFEQYSHHSFDERKAINEKTPVKLFHFVQSFRPSDNVTPELAHEIAEEWAKKAFGKDRQIIISTHIDKGHIHSHVIINPYDFNGVKFNSNRTTLEAVRGLSDSIALSYGIKPIPKKNKTKRTSYKEWDERKKGTSWKQAIKDTIDLLVYDVQSLEELYEKIQEKGYIIKRGKHTTISLPVEEGEKKKSVRIDNIKSFGEGYDENSLAERIRIAIEHKQADRQRKKAAEKADMSDMEKLYSARIYELGQLIRNGEKVPKKYNRKLPYSIENDYDVYHIALQLQIIKRDKIHSINGLENMILDVKKAHEECRQQLNKLDERSRQLKIIIENAEQYFELSGKKTLSQAEKLKLQISEKVVKQVSVKSMDDVAAIKRMYEQANTKAEQLKQRYNSLEKRFNEYTDIAQYYKKLSRTDYITELINEQKRRPNKLE